MEDFYMFGAGINGLSCVSYFQKYKKHIIAFIDSDDRRWGKKYWDVDVISFEEYLKNGNRLPVLVTPFFSQSIINILKKYNIKYFCAPWIEYFYSDGSEIIKKLNLRKYKKITFYDEENPFLADIKERLSDNRSALNASIGKNGDDESCFIALGNETQLDRERLKRENKDFFDLIELYKTKFYFKNENLINFKNIHAKKRCFIIGNGPSLTIRDLDILYQNNEICFGMNAIYESFSSTRWRPTYYAMVDMNMIHAGHDAIKEIKKIPAVKFFRRDSILEKNELHKAGFEVANIEPVMDTPRFSFDIVKGIYGGGTVAYDALQIASYMGFSEIYLLGLDMTSSPIERLHFYKEQDDISTYAYFTKQTNKCFEYAEKILDERGVKLRNATRGGELDEVTRVDFDSLF